MSEALATITALVSIIVAIERVVVDLIALTLEMWGILFFWTAVFSNRKAARQLWILAKIIGGTSCFIDDSEMSMTRREITGRGETAAVASDEECHEETR